MNNYGPNESRTISLHPIMWQWLSELAQRDYEGNMSAAVAGLIAYDRGIYRAKEIKGQRHSHAITAGLVHRRETLDALIREIEGADPGFNALTWLEIQRQKSSSSPTEEQPH